MVLTLLTGAGASAAEGASVDQAMAVNVAKECLLAATKADAKSAHIWANLANAFYMSGDHRSSSKCLEKVFTGIATVIYSIFIKVVSGFLLLVLGRKVLIFDSLQ